VCEIAETTITDSGAKNKIGHTVGKNIPKVSLRPATKSELAVTQISSKHHFYLVKCRFRESMGSHCEVLGLSLNILRVQSSLSVL
jgi:hypothetical protein